MDTLFCSDVDHKYTYKFCMKYFLYVGNYKQGDSAAF
jgi:hypothetical protein